MYETVLYFTIYSFLGWVCECLYCGIPARKFINRGFLNGPVCPVYGFGALFVIELLSRFKDNILLLFILAFIVTSIVEYITSYLLETIFHLKWWDYSGHKFNIHGRVCLLNSTLFGLLSVFLIELVNPLIMDLVNKIPERLIPILGNIIIIIFTVDMISTVTSLLNLKGKLVKIGKITDELKEIDLSIKEFSEHEFGKIMEGIKKGHETINNKRKIEGILHRVKDLKSQSISQKRLLKAFPNLHGKKYHEQLQKLKELLNEHRK